MINLEELKAHLHLFFQDVDKQFDDDKQATTIIKDFIAQGHITEEQEEYLKSQVENSLKAIGLMIPMAILPGASILVPLLIKVAAAHHIDLLPEDFQNL